MPSFALHLSFFESSTLEPMAAKWHAHRGKRKHKSANLRIWVPSGKLFASAPKDFFRWRDAFRGVQRAGSVS